MKLLIITIGILLAISTFISHANSNSVDPECARGCIEAFDLNGCIQDELNYWETDDGRDAERTCYFLMKQERIYCLMENCNYQPPKEKES